MSKEIFEGGLDIDGQMVTVQATVSDKYATESIPELVDITIVIPALEPWAADMLMRSISKEWGGFDG